MAGGQERVLRRRIRSVQSTKKITKAMELIAASQIVRAQNRIVANRPYRQGMAHIVLEAALADPRAAAKLLGTPESPSAVGIVAVVGDRGLSGAYNTSVFRAAERLAEQHAGAGRGVQLFTVGKKAPGHFRYKEMDIERSFVGFNDRPTFANAREVAAAASAPFLTGEIDLLVMVSTRFFSAGSQSVAAQQLLPVPLPEGRDVDAEPAPTRPQGLHRVRAGPREAAGRSGAAGRRVRDLLGAARGDGLVFHRAATGDGRRVGQRGRAHPNAESHHEPRPSGRDHDRDHGNRRRSRGAPPLEGSLTR